MEFRVAETTDGFVMSSCCLVTPRATFFIRLSELRVAPDEQHVYKFEFEVTEHMCKVWLFENTFSIHVTVGTTQNTVEISTVQELVI